jgi:hypothetical protein
LSDEEGFVMVVPDEVIIDAVNYRRQSGKSRHGEMRRRRRRAHVVREMGKQSGGSCGCDGILSFRLSCSSSSHFVGKIGERIICTDNNECFRGGPCPDPETGK